MADKYIVTKYSVDQLEQLKKQWDELYRGVDMTYNQSYDWNAMLINYTPQPKGVDCNFRLVKKDDKPIMIAPLWIITRRINLFNAPGVYLIGRGWYTDYINLIYDEFDESAFLALLADVKKEYGNLPWHFELLKESSALYGYLQRASTMGSCNIHIDSRTICGTLNLPGTKEEYYKSLKKSMKERLNRIANRTKKEDRDFGILVDDKIHVDECVNRYNIRNALLKKRAKERISLKGKMYLTMRAFLYDRCLIKFPQYMPFLVDQNVKLATVIDRSSDIVAAFMSFVPDQTHKTIQVVQIALNDEYGRYSPGIMLAKYIIDNSIENGYEFIDFTRGGEQYKFDLGSESRYVANLKVRF